MRRIAIAVALLLVGAGVLEGAFDAPAFPGSVEGVGYAQGAFFVRVSPRFGMGTRWLASTDGGATWARSIRPVAPATAAEVGPESWSACSGDGTCYRVRMDHPRGDCRHLAERRAPGSDWVVEAELDTAPALTGLAVNPSDGTQAVAISWGYGFRRDASGMWQTLDLIEIGSDPPWLQRVVSWLDSTLITRGVALVVSILCWMLLPTLAWKWVGQLVTLAVAGVLHVYSIFHLGMGLFWPNLGFAAGALAVVLSVRGHGRPSPPGGSPSAAPPGFDPPNGAR